MHLLPLPPSKVVWGRVSEGVYPYALMPYHTSQAGRDIHIRQVKYTELRDANQLTSHSRKPEKPNDNNKKMKKGHRQTRQPADRFLVGLDDTRERVCMREITSCLCTCHGPPPILTLLNVPLNIVFMHYFSLVKGKNCTPTLNYTALHFHPRKGSNPSFR